MHEHITHWRVYNIPHSALFGLQILPVGANSGILLPNSQEI